MAEPDSGYVDSVAMQYGFAALHNRILPGISKPVDHILVTPSRVVLLRESCERGRVDAAKVGGWLQVGEHCTLRVGRSDLTGFLAETVQMRERLWALLDTPGMPLVPVVGVISLLNAEFPHLGSSASLYNVTVTGPSLTRVLAGCAQGDAPTEHIAEYLAGVLPVA